MYKIEGPEDGGSGPKGPNFKLVVTLFAATIVVIIVVALFMMGGAAKLINPVHPNPHPTSRLEMIRPDRLLV